MNSHSPMQTLHAGSEQRACIHATFFAAVRAATMPVSKFRSGGGALSIIWIAKRLLIRLPIFLEVTIQHHNADRGADEHSIIFGNHL